MSFPPTWLYSPRATGQTNDAAAPSVARAGAFVDQVEAVLDARGASIEIVEPTCEADVILVQAEDITAQVNNLTLDPGEPGNDLILLFADLAELAEDPLPLGGRSAPR